MQNISRRRPLIHGRRPVDNLYYDYENESTDNENDDPDLLDYEPLQKPLPLLEDLAKPAVSSRFVGNGGYIFTFFLLVVVFLLYDGILATEETLDVDNLVKDLTTNVQDQTDAVNIVIESVKKMYKLEQKLDIVTFFGSTGVGKTFIAHIVKKYFPSSTYQLHGPLNNFQDKFVDKVKVDKHRFNLIIIDDLTAADVDVLLELIKKMPHELGLIVICIFNIQDTDTNLNYTINYNQIDDILNKFNEAGVSPKVARFHEFNRKQTGDWIMKQLGAKFPDETDRFKVTETVLAGQDWKHHGLKGLSSKLNVIKL